MALPCFSTLEVADKTAKIQFSLVTYTPLTKFLQNNMNFSPAIGLEAKIGKKDALLQAVGKPLFLLRGGDCPFTQSDPEASSTFGSIIAF